MSSSPRNVARPHGGFTRWRLALGGIAILVSAFVIQGIGLSNLAGWFGDACHAEIVAVEAALQTLMWLDMALTLRLILFLWEFGAERFDEANLAGYLAWCGLPFTCAGPWLRYSEFQAQSRSLPALDGMWRREGAIALLMAGASLGLAAIGSFLETAGWPGKLAILYGTSPVGWYLNAAAFAWLMRVTGALGGIVVPINYDRPFSSGNPEHDVRILIATWHQAIMGGTETYLRDVIPALRARGHEIGLLVENRAATGQSTIDMDEAPLWHLTSESRDRVLGDIVAWRPALCYLHGLEQPRFQDDLARRFPTVLFAHNYHGTCISGAKRFAYPQERPCDRTFGPACLIHYLPCGCGGKNPFAMIRLYARQRARLRLLHRYAAIAVASRAMQEEYIRHGVPPEQLHRIPLFPTSAVNRFELPEHRRTGRVLLLGRLTDTKGGHLALDAMARAAQRLPFPLELIIAGDGPERSRLERLARECRVATRFLGWVDVMQRTELLEQADVLIMPSVWPEPFGLVGLEAACSGVPTVAFAVGGIPDWLIPGVTGELAPGDPPTADGLADALVRAMADEAHYQRLRVGAWHSTKAFRRDDHIRRLEAIFERVAADSIPSMSDDEHRRDSEPCAVV